MSRSTICCRPGHGRCAAGSGEVVVSAGGGAVGAPLLQRRPGGAAADGAGRPDLAPAGRREHAGGGACGARAARPDEESSSSRRGPTSLRLLRNATLSISQAGYNTTDRDAVLRRPRRPRALRHGRETEQTRSRGAAGRARHGGRRAAGHAVAGDPGRCRRAGPGRPLVRSFPPLRRRRRSGGDRCALLIRGWRHERAGRPSTRKPRAGARPAAPPICGGATTMPPMPAPALDRLLELHRRRRCRSPLAVVPARATPALAERLAHEPGVDVLQHGYAHVNHAPPGDKKIELGPHRPAMIVLGELGTGWLALERLFGNRRCRCMVPPWNRIAPGLVPDLAGDRLQRPVDLRIRAPRPTRFADCSGQHPCRPDRLEGRAASSAKRRRWARSCRRSAHARTVPRTSRSASSVIILRWTSRAWDFLKSLWERMSSMPGSEIRPAHDLFARRREARAVEFCRSALSAPDAVGRLCPRRRRAPCCAALPLLAGRGQSLARADPGGRLRAVRRCSSCAPRCASTRATCWDPTRSAPTARPARWSNGAGSTA